MSTSERSNAAKGPALPGTSGVVGAGPSKSKADTVSQPCTKELKPVATVSVARPQTYLFEQHLMHKNNRHAEPQKRKAGVLGGQVFGRLSSSSSSSSSSVASSSSLASSAAGAAPRSAASTNSTWSAATTATLLPAAKKTRPTPKGVAPGLAPASTSSPAPTTAASSAIQAPTATQTPTNSATAAGAKSTGITVASIGTVAAKSTSMSPALQHSVSRPGPSTVPSATAAVVSTTPPPRPHIRTDCRVLGFCPMPMPTAQHQHAHNARTCDQCLCYVCGIAASKCNFWSSASANLQALSNAKSALLTANAAAAAAAATAKKAAANAAAAKAQVASARSMPEASTSKQPPSPPSSAPSKVTGSPTGSKAPNAVASFLAETGSIDSAASISVSTDSVAPSAAADAAVAHAASLEAAASIAAAASASAAKVAAVAAATVAALSKVKGSSVNMNFAHCNARPSLELWRRLRVAFRLTTLRSNKPEGLDPTRELYVSGAGISSQPRGTPSTSAGGATLAPRNATNSSSNASSTSTASSSVRSTTSISHNSQKAAPNPAVCMSGTPVTKPQQRVVRRVSPQWRLQQFVQWMAIGGVLTDWLTSIGPSAATSSSSSLPLPPFATWGSRDSTVSKPAGLSDEPQPAIIRVCSCRPQSFCEHRRRYNSQPRSGAIHVHWGSLHAALAERCAHVHRIFGGGVARIPRPKHVPAPSHVAAATAAAAAAAAAASAMRSGSAEEIAAAKKAAAAAKKKAPPPLQPSDMVMLASSMLDGVLILEYVTAVALRLQWVSVVGADVARDREAFLALVAELSYLWMVAFTAQPPRPFPRGPQNGAPRLPWQLQELHRQFSARLPTYVLDALQTKLERSIESCEQVGHVRKIMAKALKAARLRRGPAGPGQWREALKSLGRKQSFGSDAALLRPLQDRVFQLMAYGVLYRGGSELQRIAACGAAEKVVTGFLAHAQEAESGNLAKESTAQLAKRRRTRLDNRRDIAEGVRVLWQLFDIDPKDDQEHFRRELQKMMQQRQQEKASDPLARKPSSPWSNKATLSSTASSTFEQTEKMVRAARHRLDVSVRRLMFFSVPSYTNFTALARACTPDEWRAKQTANLVESRLKAMALPKRFLCLVESGSVSTAFGEVLDIARRMRTAGRSRSPSLVRSRANSMATGGGTGTDSKGGRSRSPPMLLSSALGRTSPPPFHTPSHAKASKFGKSEEKRADEILAVDELQQVLVLVVKCLRRKEDTYMKALSLARQQHKMQAEQRRRQQKQQREASPGTKKGSKVGVSVGKESGTTDRLEVDPGSPLARAAAALRGMMVLAEGLALASCDACEQLPRVCVGDLSSVLCPLIDYLARLTVVHAANLDVDHKPFASLGVNSSASQLASSTTASTPVTSRNGSKNPVTAASSSGTVLAEQDRTKVDAVIASARKEAGASVLSTLRKLRRGLFLVDPTFENFECWRQAERADYWSADAKQFVVERVLRRNVSVGEKLEFFMRVGLFNEYNQVLRSFDRVVNGYGPGGALPAQALVKLEARVANFLKAVHHRAVLFANAPTNPASPPASSLNGGVSKMAGTSAKVKKEAATSNAASCDSANVAHADELFLSHSSPPLKLPQLCDLLNALAQVDRGRFCNAVQEHVRLRLHNANKRGSLSFSSSLGSTAGGLDSSDPAVSTTGSIPATEFLSGHRSILDKLYFSDEVVELVTEILKSKLREQKGELVKEHVSQAGRPANSSSVHDAKDFVHRLQLWLYCLSDARCPHGFPPRHASVLSLWQAVSKTPGCGMIVAVALDVITDRVEAKFRALPALTDTYRSWLRDWVRTSIIIYRNTADQRLLGQWLARFGQLRRALGHQPAVAQEIGDLMKPMRDEHESSRALSSSNSVVSTASTSSNRGAGATSLEVALEIKGDLGGSGDEDSEIDMRGLVGHKAAYVVVLTHGIDSQPGDDSGLLSHLASIAMPSPNDSSDLEDILRGMPSLVGIGHALDTSAPAFLGLDSPDQRQSPQLRVRLRFTVRHLVRPWHTHSRLPEIAFPLLSEIGSPCFRVAIFQRCWLLLGQVLQIDDSKGGDSNARRGKAKSSKNGRRTSSGRKAASRGDGSGVNAPGESDGDEAEAWAMFDSFEDAHTEFGFDDTVTGLVDDDDGDDDSGVGASILMDDSGSAAVRGVNNDSGMGGHGDDDDDDDIFAATQTFFDVLV